MVDWLIHATSAVASLAAVRNGEEFVTELRDIPQGWYALGGIGLLAGLCGVAFWMYRHEGRGGASARVRTLLAVVRCAVIVTVAVILLDPIRVRILRKWIDSYTIVLVDDSSSMGLADTYRDESARVHVKNVVDLEDGASIRRTDLIPRLLEANDRALLKGLAARNRVKLYTFSDEPELQATIRAGWEVRSGGDEDDSIGAVTTTDVEHATLSLGARGTATNLERALRRTIESLGSAPIAGVVVLTDGGVNQGAAPSELARYARERRIPVYPIGIGDPSPPRNVRIAEVVAPDNAFQGDPFPIKVRVTADGLDGERIELVLRELDTQRGGAAREVERKSVRVGPGGAIENVIFERTQNRVGRFVYKVEAPLLDAESVADDNSKQVSVNVIDARTRVLIVSGEPSWQYLFVSRLLQRDKTFDVSCWLQSADLSAVRDGNTVIDHLPILPEELYAYDLVILADPSPDDLNEDWCRLLDTFVTEHGGGLLYLAARPHTPALLRAPWFAPVRDMLPVAIDPEADLILNQIGHYQSTPGPIEIPESAFGHPVLRTGADVASAKLAWRGVGDVYWYYPVLREKPAATVLMRHGGARMRNGYGGHVLAALQFVGAGRTGFLAFDSSWRWRRYDVNLFDRFWVQLSRYLSEGKLLGGSKRGMILTERDQYAIGDAVSVSARLFDEHYEPIQQTDVRARYRIDHERHDFLLASRPDQPGWFEGRFVPDRIGAYEISLTLPGTSPDESVEIVREIRVARPNIEIIRPQMARTDLMTLADGSFGGRYFDVDGVGDLADLIPDLHAEIPIRSRPTTLWDNGWTLAWLVMLLSIEWGLRKWNRLL